MAVDKHNYEAFFLDYSEGNLSAELTAELLLFLEENPSFKQELEGFEIIELTPINSSSINKEALKIQINAENAEEYIIGSIEGVLSSEDENELQQLLKIDSASEKLSNRYKKTILSIPSIPFPHKNSLKKKSRIVYLYPLIGAAASVLLYFALGSDSPLQEYNPQHLNAFSTTILSENDSFNFIVKENVIPQENNSLVENKQHTNPIQKDTTTLNGTDITPLNNDNLMVEIKVKDSLKDGFDKEKISNPEILIVVNNNDATKPTKDTLLNVEIANNGILSFNEWTNGQIRTKILNQETDDVSKIKKDEVFNAVASGLNKVSKQEIAYHAENTQTTTTKGFSIGRFEFSRTKRKKI